MISHDTEIYFAMRLAFIGFPDARISMGTDRTHDIVYVHERVGREVYRCVTYWEPSLPPHALERYAETQAREWRERTAISRMGASLARVSRGMTGLGAAMTKATASMVESIPRLCLTPDGNINTPWPR